MGNMASTPLSFVRGFDAERPGLPGAGLAWLKTLRLDGIERFNVLGLPTPKLEAWKNTRLKPLEDTDFRLVTGDDGAAAVDLLPSVLPESNNHTRLVFVNGRMRPELMMEGDLPDGVLVDCLKDVLASGAEWAQEYLSRIGEAEDQALFALNTAMMDSGFVLRVDPGVVVERPIEVIYLGGLTAQPVANFPRNLIVLGEGAQATVVKHHAGLGVGAYFANSVTEVDLGPGARL